MFVYITLEGLDTLSNSVALGKPASVSQSEAFWHLLHPALWESNLEVGENDILSTNCFSKEHFK